ncbi:hypothetical protein [Nonomuraea sp. NPDC052265]|uniref:hypothetical protein n=1 Tax=Nonomuraea sp. NPDC052265 TaxID=3364374 RepID=UPI0037C85E07
MRGFFGIIAVIQGLGGFVGRVWFDTEWGFVGRLVELPLAAYPGLAAAGLALLVWADHDRKNRES